MKRGNLFAGLLIILLLAGPGRPSIVASPVSFSFTLPATGQNPFVREIWAEVTLPSGECKHVPAFFAGDETYSVRLRAGQRGDYVLAGVTETQDEHRQTRPLQPVGPATIHVAEVEPRPSVLIDPDMKRFVLSDGERYVPIGTSLAWAPKEQVEWYREAFREFSEQGLNWTRIWMAHWGGLNLDWVPGDPSPALPLGRLDLHVAADWDQIITEAEKRGVYVQVVLQHHGQWSTQVNSNWAENPWNAANPGGFLHSPTEFFTSPEAIRLTEAKYRYIVARWGYSPAVLAWELFNEVHWVDALRIDHNETAVAAWHDRMAAAIRAIDVHHHLITTSTDDIRSPIYGSMDYFQPHLYGADMLACVRTFDVSPAQLDRPVFYGEIGDDHMPLSDEQKTSGVELVPLVWASLMGQGRYPAQLWQGELMLARKRLPELGAVARFVAETKLPGRGDLVPFAAAVSGGRQVPLMLHPGRIWHRQPSPEITVAMDGRAPADYAALPGILVGAPASIAEGYPDRITLHVTYGSAATLVIRFANAGPLGAVAQLLLDGQPAGRHEWLELAAAARAGAPARPAEIRCDMPPGPHVLTIQNRGGPDWCQLDSIDFGINVSALAAVGRRAPDFIALWLWSRDGVFALEPPAAAAGMLQVRDVPAGKWHVSWWDTLEGKPIQETSLTHPGGVLRIPTPPIARHAAVVLTRADRAGSED